MQLLFNSFQVLTSDNTILTSASVAGTITATGSSQIGRLNITVTGGTLAWTCYDNSPTTPTTIFEFKNGWSLKANRYTYGAEFSLWKNGTQQTATTQCGYAYPRFPLTFYFTFVTNDTNSNIQFASLCLHPYYNQWFLDDLNLYSPWANNLGGLILDGSELTSDPYQFAPDSTPDGGYGDFDYKSDAIPLPSAPSISVSDSGFVTLYKPSLGQLQALAAYMWSGLFDMATFRKIFADPMDCIISLALMPVDPTASGSQELKVGNIGTGITIDKISTQFVEVTFDSLNIGLRANSFMDYSPYTKAQIYLPFIGTRSLSIDDIAGKNIKLKYIIDVFTGACNASLGVDVTAKDGTTKTTTLYQFTGNVLANVPVTANNFASFLQATIGAVSTAVGVATGAGALPAIASAVNAATSMKPDIEKSGNLSATAGFLGVQKPYLILTYPNLCRPEGRDKVTGTPAFLGLSNSKKLSAFHGFTQLHRINVQGISCTETERQMILSQLTGEGVILP